MYNNQTLLGHALREFQQRLTGELVLLPSASQPGTVFAAVTNELIRHRNLLRWRASATRRMSRGRRSA